MSYRTQMQLKEKYNMNQGQTSPDRRSPERVSKTKSKHANTLFKASSHRKIKVRETSRQSSEVRNDYLHNMTLDTSVK